MAAGSLLALLDDIATILDDVSIMTKTAAKKTVGVLSDDLALNAEQVSGVKADRELPVVWAVAKGSLVNKSILVPLALLISAFVPWLITPLLMVGGAYLCFEGAEKLAHKFLHSAAERQAHHEEHLRNIQQAPKDVVRLEKDKIKGAIRTDFILSAEIMAITLGVAQGQPLLVQFAVLASIGLALTAGVYGLVAGIVKLDDLGLLLSQRVSPVAQATGKAILAAAPWLMKTLSVLGTAAMFLVGGGILVHGLPFLEHTAQELDTLGAFIGSASVIALNAVVGLVAGALVMVAVKAVQKLRRKS